MMWLFAILIVLAMGAVAAVAAGYGRPMARVYDDRPDVVLPGGDALDPAALRRVRFTTALRGYRMSEVDALPDPLARQLESGGGERHERQARPPSPDDDDH